MCRLFYTSAAARFLNRATGTLTIALGTPVVLYKSTLQDLRLLHANVHSHISLLPHIWVSFRGHVLK